MDIFGSGRNLRIAYYLGVRCIGVTWNYANWAADGVLETRNGGFSIKGKRLVKECNKLGILIDISHLAEAGIDTFIPDLEHVGKYDYLVNELSKKYAANFVEKLVFGNWMNFLKNSLHPKSRY